MHSSYHVLNAPASNKDESWHMAAKGLVPANWICQPSSFDEKKINEHKHAQKIYMHIQELVWDDTNALWSN